MKLSSKKTSNKRKRQDVIVMLIFYVNRIFKKSMIIIYIYIMKDILCKTTSIESIDI